MILFCLLYQFSKLVHVLVVLCWWVYLREVEQIEYVYFRANFFLSVAFGNLALNIIWCGIDMHNFGCLCHRILTVSFLKPKLVAVSFNPSLDNNKGNKKYI